jgi:hypothetical protein
VRLNGGSDKIILQKMFYGLAFVVSSVLICLLIPALTTPTISWDIILGTE